MTCRAFVVWLGVVVGLLFGVCGCGGPGAGTVTALTVTCQSSSVPINETTTCSAAVNVANQTSTTSQSTNTAVTWEINGVAGGNISTTGSIATSATDVQAGIYTAPSKVPGTNSGQVTITAVAPINPTKSTSITTNIVTSNAITITIGGGVGLAIAAPLAPSVPAGGTHQFAATLNGVADPSATWTVTPINGGNAGSINATSGLYTAPFFPPSGGLVTITATDAQNNAGSASTTAQIVYSDLTLRGSYAFSYTGNDSGGFMAAAGTFSADGQGHITTGIEDITSSVSPQTLVSIEPTCSTGTSNYVVGADGRGQAVLCTTSGSQTLEFVLTTDQHAIITRFDLNSSATGSGSMDQQTLGLSSISAGSYVLSAAGTDSSLHPEAMAGEFNSPDGVNITSGVFDVHDTSPSTASVTNSPLGSGSGYTFNTANNRGTITLNTPAGVLTFAFYIVSTAQLDMVEVDGAAHLGGIVYSAPPLGSFSSASLASPNYVFTAGGVSGTTTVGPYATGGAFVSSGTGTISSGVIDVNNQGTVTTNTSLTSCPYTIDSNTGRIDLKLCTSGSTSEFAAYQSASGQAVSVEIDTNALTTGIIYPQTNTAALATGGFSVGLASQGIFNTAGAGRPSSAQNIDGQFSTLNGFGGNLDINFHQPIASDPINSTISSFGSPGTNGRGTLILAGSDPAITYNTLYYLIDANTALVFNQSNSTSAGTGFNTGVYVLTGMLERQF